MHRAGLALVGSLCFWILISAVVSWRPPWAMLAVVGISTGGYVVGRLLARDVTFWALPAGVIFVGLVEVYKSPSESFSYLSSHGFLGYANAKAAFFVQAAFATVVVFARNRSWKVGAGLLPVLVLFLAIPVYSQALGAFLSSLIIVPAVYVAVFRRGHRPLVIAATLLVALTFLSSLFISRALSDGIAPGTEARVAEVLDPGRAASWAEAYRILAEHPVFGAGPGAFAELSPIARREAGLRWAHNGVLQIGAELGIVGLFLVLSLFAWAFIRLSSPVAGSSTVVALAVGAFAAHASADYLLHFPFLPAVVAAMVGSTPLRSRRGV